MLLRVKVHQNLYSANKDTSNGGGINFASMRLNLADQNINHAQFAKSVRYPSNVLSSGNDVESGKEGDNQTKQSTDKRGSNEWEMFKQWWHMYGHYVIKVSHVILFYAAGGFFYHKVEG